jgi:hypothetical protein
MLAIRVRSAYIRLSQGQEPLVAKITLKKTEKAASDDRVVPDAEVAVAAQKPEPEPVRSQKRAVEAGRFLLQVDRQTKGYFQSAAEAEAAGMKIKKGFANVHVSIYDREQSSNTVLELPA